MLIHGLWQNHPLTFSVKSTCLTVSQELPSGSEVFSYDWSGRLWTALLEGISYRRGLDGKIIARWQGLEGSERRWLGSEEADRFLDRARRRLLALEKDLCENRVALDMPLPSQALGGVRCATAFDALRAQADADRYRQVYLPVGILPPDQYMAVVLQATEGCAFNTCTFCSFYRDRLYRVKSAEAFLAHARQVRDFLGAGLTLRRTIFFGDANALATPMPRLLPLFEAAHQVYAVEELGGIFAFLDGFSGEKKTARDYSVLAEMGLRRIYIGLESGNEGLLKFLHKPGSAAEAVRTVQACKAGGLSVGVIVLLGAGGQVYGRAHIRDTVRALNAMQLGQDDLIYFSELVLSEGMPYVAEAFQADLKPLSKKERAAQQAAIERGLKFSRQSGVPNISRYDIREFAY